MEYSNSNFLILAAIIEEEDYYFVLNQFILQLLNLRYVYSSDSLSSYSLSKKYVFEDNYLLPEPKWKKTNILGAGGIYSTSSDLLKWINASNSAGFLSSKGRASLKRKNHNMKNVLLIILILGFTSCKMNNETIIIDNSELAQIYKNDQADRQTDNIDWNIVSKNDSIREVRVYELLDSNKVQTSKDYHNAAMIFQHGGDSIAYGMAVKLMRKSIELDSTANKWLLAAAIDRHLLSMDKPQIYGTQYFRMSGEPWGLREIDTTQISDVERIEYGVETLAEQREKVKQMNRKKLSELLTQGKSVDDIIGLIKSENTKDSEFDISENGINNFGYNILGKGENEDALKIFELNTELYPNGFNTWDSYGECLMLLGEKEEGIKAYKKSLELNPKNKNAEMIIKEEK